MCVPENRRGGRLLGLNPLWGDRAAGSKIHPGQRRDDSHLRNRDRRHIACWGDNRWGQSTSSPGTFIQVSAAPATDFQQTCAVRIDGAVLCWGDNTFNQTAAPAGSSAR